MINYLSTCAPYAGNIVYYINALYIIEKKNSSLYKY